MDGNPYRVAARLIYWVATNYRTIDPVARSQGVDLLSLPPPAFMNYARHLLLSNLDARSRDRVVSQLELPLTAEEPVDDGVWSPEAQASSFRAAMAELG